MGIADVEAHGHSPHGQASARGKPRVEGPKTGKGKAQVLRALSACLVLGLHVGVDRNTGVLGLGEPYYIYI